MKSVILVSPVLLSGCLFVPVGREVPQAWTAPSGETYELVWNDEFDGNSVDASKWDCPVQFRQGASLWHPSNVQVTNGCAHFDIKAGPSKKISYESACLRTLKRKSLREPEKPLFTYTYGYTEVRCRLPERCDGDYWAAFWLQGVEMGRAGTDSRKGLEVDVLETQTLVRPEGTCWISFHWGGYGEEHSSFTLKPKYPPLRDRDWHVFGVLWTEREYVFYLDGKEIARTDLVNVGPLNEKTATPPQGVLAKPAYIKLSCEAGAWCGKTGDFDLDGALYDSFDVDYVRVYQRKAD